MGLLDDAIREHLELMRRHGANEAEIARREAEALGPVLRDEGEGQEGGFAPTAAEGEPSLPYDRAAEAGLTGESDLPSFEWHGSSTAEPEVPSFISPEPVRDIEPEPGGMDAQADPDVVSAPTEAFDVVAADRPAEERAAGEAELSVEAAPGVEEPEVWVEPELPEGEGALPEDPSAEVSPEPRAAPEPLEEAATPEPHEAAVPEPEEAAAPEPEEAPPPDAEDPFRPPPTTTESQPPQPEGSFDAAPAEADVSLEEPAEATLPEEQSIESTASVEVGPEVAEAPPPEDETAVGPPPTEGVPPALPEADPSEAVPVLDVEADPSEAAPVPGIEAQEEPSVPAPRDLEDLPPEVAPAPAEGGPLAHDAEDFPPEQEPPPLAAGEVADEPPVEVDPGEPPLEAPPGEEFTAFHPSGAGGLEPPSSDLEELPPEPEPTYPEGGPLGLEAEELPPEQEPPPLTAGEVAEEPPVGLGPEEAPLEAAPVPPIEEPQVRPTEEPPIEEPFVAGEEKAWREAGEAPGDIPDSRPEPPLEVPSPEDLEPQAAEPLEADAVLEPGEEPPQRPLPGSDPHAELPPPESLDASPEEPLDPAGGPPPALPGDSQAARGFFEETAEHERRSSEESAPTADPDFGD